MNRKKQLLEESIIIDLSNKLININSIKKILITSRKILSNIDIPLSHINVINNNDSSVFSPGNPTFFINALHDFGKSNKVNLKLKDIFNQEIKKSKVLRLLLQKKKKILAAGHIKNHENLMILNFDMIFKDLYKSNIIFKEIIDTYSYKYLLKKLKLKYYLLIPIYDINKVIAYISIIGSKKDKSLNTHDIDRLISIRNIISTSIINLKYKQILIERNTILKKKNTEIEEIQEYERKNISTIIHDSIAQMLAVSCISLDMIKKNINSISQNITKTINEISTVNKNLNSKLPKSIIKNLFLKKNITSNNNTTKILNNLIKKASNIKEENINKSIKPLLKKITKDNNQMIKITRNLIDLLNPKIISKKNLFKILIEDFSDIEDFYKINIFHDFKGNLNVLDNFFQTNLYKIIREIFYNIIKHSKSRIVNFKLNITNNKIYILVKDNGKGFDVTKIDNLTTHGIKNIQRKVTMMSGNFKIFSKIGKGTIVFIKLNI